MSTTDTTQTRTHITADECAEIRTRDAEGEHHAHLATAFGCAKSTIWYHATGECSHGVDSEGACIVSRPHLTQTAPAGTRLTTEHPQEAYCWDCKARITVAPDGIEYGHRRRRRPRNGGGRCPNRPAQCDSNAPSKFKLEGQP